MAIVQRKSLRPGRGTDSGSTRLDRHPAGTVLGAPNDSATDNLNETVPGDIGLVERAMTGDADAFDALVQVRLMSAFRLARAILGTTEEAEDATQDAFIAAWRSLASLRDPRRFDAWFGRILVNTCRMSMRRRPRAVIVSIESIANGQPVWADDPSLDGLVATDALNRAIDRLPVEHRAILALYYLEDRSVAVTATMLGIPTGTAKWRLSEARAALRSALAGDDGQVLPLGSLADGGPDPRTQMVDVGSLPEGHA